MTTTAPVVAFDQVSKAYDAVRAVDGLTLPLHPGETVALLGPNGAGKSTTLEIAEWLPTHAYAALGQAIEQSRAPHVRDLAVLAVSFALFAGGAAWLYRKDTAKA